jgi:cell division protein FtsB
MSETADPLVKEEKQKDPLVGRKEQLEAEKKEKVKMLATLQKESTELLGEINKLDGRIEELDRFIKEKEK